MVRAFADESLEDLLDLWHKSDYGLSLVEWLGCRPQDYAYWVEGLTNFISCELSEPAKRALLAEYGERFMERNAELLANLAK